MKKLITRKKSFILVNGKYKTIKKEILGEYL
jgi:hypothetical protein